MKGGWDSLPLLQSLQSREASVCRAEKDMQQNPQTEALKQKNKHYKLWPLQARWSSIVKSACRAGMSQSK